MQNTAKQNHRGLVTSYDTRPGNDVGWFYNVSKSTRGKKAQWIDNTEALIWF